MILKFNVQTNIDPNMIVDACSIAEKKLIVQVMKDTKPYVPALTEAFSNSARIIGKNIVYSGVQARYLYEGKVMIDSETGKGARWLGDEIGYRHRKGAVLIPSERSLNYTTAVHAKAQAHWCEASKADNLEKWRRIAEKLLGEEL